MLLRRILAGAADKFQRTYGTQALPTPERIAMDARKARASTAAPVFPNEGVTAWYRQQLQKILRDMTVELLPMVSEAMQDSKPVIGFAEDAKKSRTDLLDKALKKWGGLWTGKLDKLSLDLSKKFADKAFTTTQAAMAKSFRDAGLTVKFQATAAAREAYKAVLSENVGLIKSIPQQYAKDVQSQVWGSVMKGGNLQELTEGIKAKYGVAQRRAELIARDQNAKAKAVLENVRRQELGITEAIWMHSHAGKVPRPTHVAMNGKRFKLSDGMYDSDVGKRIWPGTEVNCRCVSRAVIPGFE